MSQPVRKVFLDDDRAGATTEYWETQWSGEVRTFDGPTRRLLETHLPNRSRLLEAGCGQGEIAAGLAGQGHSVVGADLARRALADCRARHPELPLAVGDVGRMPFPDATFDAVVSLGVVEHFEAGPLDLLREQARVLADDGVLFLTVPARSWYRRWSDTRHVRLGRSAMYRQKGRLVGLRPAPVVEVSPTGAFHQYEFPRRMIEDLCTRAGLRVEFWQPFGVAWALGDSAAIGRMVARGAGTSHDQAPLAAAGPDPSRPGGRAGALRRYLRTPVIEEQGHDPLQRALAWAATRAFGHMQLLVARPHGRSR